MQQLLLVHRLALLLLSAAIAVVDSQEVPGRGGARDHLHRQPCPSLFTIGAQKCGTATFHGHLKSVFPEVSNTLRKEYHAFDVKELPFEPSRIKAAYADGVLRPWEDGVGNLTRSDGTPAYLRDPKAPQRMKAFCTFDKEPRFVVLLCDPSMRVWSAFAMGAGRMLGVERARRAQEASNGTFLPGLFDACVRSEVPAVSQCLREFGYAACGDLLYGGLSPGVGTFPGRPKGQDALGHVAPCSGHLYGSLFSEQLEHWSRFFPRESFLVLEREQWSLDPWGAMLAAAEHFGLPEPTEKPRNLVAPGAYIANVGHFHGTAEPHEGTLQMLRGFFEGRDRWRAWISRRGQPSSVSSGHDDRVGSSGGGGVAARDAVEVNSGDGNHQL